MTISSMSVGATMVLAALHLVLVAHVTVNGTIATNVADCKLLTELKELLNLIASPIHGLDYGNVCDLVESLPVECLTL